MSDNILLYGFEEAPPEQIQLRAGALSLMYENGALRHISYAGNEIIRNIYIALRDKNWGTHPFTIENEKINADNDSFDIEYTSLIKENNGLIFSWYVTIQGEEAGKITITANGKAIQDILKNRAGFCILHPIKNTAGEKLVVHRKDGSITGTFFPETIAPHIPLSFITKLQWQNDGNDYTLEMKGDSFEMEDQRNWTDASFKTFCTPLSLPHPVQLKKVDTVFQQIIFYPVKELPSVPSGKNDYISISIDESKKNKLPLTGTGASTEIASLSTNAIEAIKKINFNYYTVEIKCSDTNWQEYLLKEIKIAETLILDLFINLELTEDYINEFQKFNKLISENNTPLKYLLITTKAEWVTSQNIIKWIDEEAKGKLPGISIGIGSSANFTEINRNRRDIGNVDFISYAIHPQEHAFDNLSLIENAAAQYDTVISSKTLYPSAKNFITPVTLRRRVNPYALQREDIARTNEQKSDPRQASLWNAGWTLASIKYLAEAGTSGITYFQTAGKQGCSDENGNIYPAGILLQYINSLKNGIVTESKTSVPLKCTSLLVETDNKTQLLLANHTGAVITIQLPFAFTRKQTIQTFPSYLQSEVINNISIIELHPYEVIILD